MNTSNSSKLSVTLAVPAYNEVGNIRVFLDSVTRQTEGIFFLERIIVISDGSTDGTAKVADMVRDERVEVRAYEERQGKPARLNAVHHELDSDVLVIADADTILAHDGVLEALITPFIHDANVLLVSGKSDPVRATTLTERAIGIGHRARDVVRGNNVFSANGHLMAYRKAFAHHVQFPEGTIGMDQYLYFACRAAGSGYRYIPQALVRFRLPATLQDAIRQNIRFSAVPARMRHYFGHELVAREFALPLRKRLNAKLSEAVRDPLAAFYAFLIYYYCGIVGRMREKQLKSQWDIAVSTKRALPILRHE